VEKKTKLTEQKAGFAHHIGGQQNGGRQKCLEMERDSLAERLKAGNRAAAAELVDIYYEQIYLFMRRLGHSCQVSEDLTQETFLQAWQHIEHLKEGKALNSWLYRIASNVSKLYWRRHKGKKKIGIEAVDTPDNSNNKIEHCEQLERLHNAVLKLPGKLRQVLVLHYMQHMTIAEAAEAAGIRKGTFKSRLSRALKVLRKQML